MGRPSPPSRSVRPESSKAGWSRPTSSSTGSYGAMFTPPARSPWARARGSSATFSTASSSPRSALKSPVPWSRCGPPPSEILSWAPLGLHCTGTHICQQGSRRTYFMSELVFTDAAALKVGDLIRAEANPKLMLRVYVQGGGCSGLQYGFEFDEALQEGDTCVENQGVKLIVDPMSVQYLMGAEIDYREGLDGAQFVIRNPNATTTCGCGSSFAA